jgi:hypothetical protein
LEGVDHRRQQVDRVAGQVDGSVHIQASADRTHRRGGPHLDHGGLARARVRPERTHQLDRRNFGQLLTDQDDPRRDLRGQAYGGHAIGRFVDPEAGLMQHAGDAEARPAIVVGNQHADALVGGIHGRL